MNDKTNLTESIKELESIVQWFDDQSEVDVEQGLEKVKSAATLIKDSKSRLAEIENEFEQIEKEIAGDSEEDGEPFKEPTTSDERQIDLSTIPF